MPPLSRKDLLSVRTDACHLAASFYSEYTPAIPELWKLANFFERALLEGTEALRGEFAEPAAKPNAAVLKLAKNWDVV